MRLAGPRSSLSRQWVVACRPRSSAHDRHFLPMARITANRRVHLAGGRIEAAPNQRQIFALERAGAPVIGEEVRQAPMRRIRLGNDQKAGRVLVEPVHNSRAA